MVPFVFEKAGPEIIRPLISVGWEKLVMLLLLLVPSAFLFALVSLTKESLALHGRGRLQVEVPVLIA